MHSRALWRLWGGLGSSARSGSHCWADTWGFEGPEIFRHIYDTPAAVLRFMRGMHAFSALSAVPVLTAFDLSPFKALVDLGGATGALDVFICLICYW